MEAWVSSGKKEIVCEEYQGMGLRSQEVMGAAWDLPVCGAVSPSSGSCGRRGFAGLGDSDGRRRGTYGEHGYDQRRLVGFLLHSLEFVSCSGFDHRSNLR